MQDLTNYTEIQSAKSAYSKVINDLVAISNLKTEIDPVQRANIDTTIVSISGNNVVVAGEYLSQIVALRY